MKNVWLGYSPSLDLFGLSVNANDEKIMDKIVSLVGYTKDKLFRWKAHLVRRTNKLLVFGKKNYKELCKSLMIPGIGVMTQY